MQLIELLEKYCDKFGDEYITHDHSFDIDPASEEQLKTFEEHCHKHGLDDAICAELLDFYKQSNSLSITLHAMTRPYSNSGRIAENCGLAIWTWIRSGILQNEKSMV